MKKIPFILVIVLTAILAQSCIFSPKSDKKDPPDEGNLVWTPPTTPRKVIENLEVSFRKRDIEFYRNCLNPDYYYISPSKIDELDITWGFSEDVRVVGNIMDASNEFIFTPSEHSIVMEYGKNVPVPSEDVIIEAGDEHPDEIWYIGYYYITMDIVTNDNSYKVQQDMQFKMVEDTDTGLFSIIRWIDETPDS